MGRRASGGPGAERPPERAAGRKPPRVDVMVIGRGAPPRWLPGVGEPPRALPGVTKPARELPGGQRPEG